MRHLHFLNVRKGITSVLLSLFLLWGNSGLWAQEFRFDRFGVREGLIQKSIICGIQDNKGFLWFGTDEGILRYDGYQFKAYQYEPEKKNPSPAVRFILFFLTAKAGYGRECSREAG